MALIGKVIAMTGVANIMNDKGEKRALHPGDQIQTGDSIQTTAGVDVDVQLANGRVIHIGADQLVAFTPELAEVFAPTQADSAVNVATIDTVIQALEQGRDINEVLEETAAGGAGGSDGSHSAVYLQRIFQALNSLGFADEGAAAGIVDPDVLTVPLPLFDAAAAPAVPTGIFVTSVTAGLVGDTDGGDGLLFGNTVFEGDDGEPLIYTVALNTATTENTNITLTFTGDGGNGGEFGVDTTTPLTLNYILNGVETTQELTVTDPSNVAVTLPAGVQLFTVKIPTQEDSLIENSGAITLTASTVNNQSPLPAAVGTILDDDVVVTGVEAGNGEVNPNTGAIIGRDVTEGEDLYYTVTLNRETVEDTVVNLSFASGSNTGGVFGEDTTNPITIIYTDNNGVVQEREFNLIGTGLSVTLPAGVSGFTVKVPTFDDQDIEPTGQISLTASTAANVAGDFDRTDVGTIRDNDNIKVNKVIRGLDGATDTDGSLLGSAVYEGDDAEPLIYTAVLNGTTVEPTVVTLRFAGDGSTGGEFADIKQEISVNYLVGGVEQSQTITLTGFGEFNVTLPAGVDRFAVKVPTLEDSLVEPDGNIAFTAFTEANDADDDIPTAVNGTILDDDVVVTGVEAGNGEVNPNTGAIIGRDVTEGEDLYYTVTLNRETVEDTVVNLSFASGSNTGGVFGEDTTNPITIIYTDNNGVVQEREFNLIGTGLSVTLPAGVSGFTVKVPTFDDQDIEPTGQISLTASTAANVAGDFDRTDVGTIRDNDSDGIELTPSGLFGEYFGYNDYPSNVGSGYRLHDDDFTKQNLDSIQDVEGIVAGRLSADVTFNARNINFGGFTYNSRDGNSPDLGDNTTQVYVPNSTTSLSDSPDNHLYNFLTYNNTSTITNATNATILEGDPHDTNGTSGLGKTTDAIIRLTGGVIVDRGIYDIRVTADDGFRLNIGGKTYAEFDGNQFIIERTFSNISFDQGGLLPIEILYWEQGGQAQLKIEVKLSSSGPNEWRTFGVDSGFAIFSQTDIDNSGLVLTGDGTRYVTSTDPDVYDNQEFYQGVDGTFRVREIETITGSGTINGTENTDKIVGSSGNDTINAGDGDDAVAGNDGDDTLNGGAGDDILNGGAGNDTMIGGVGDDVYGVDSIGDIVTEAVNGGTDTIQYEVDIGNVTLADNIENATILHGGDVSITGNGANNILRGGAGSNTINGGDGNDRIYGGAGNDFLTGGSGNDVFVWELSDKGPIGSPSEDRITDFVYTGNGQGNIKDVPAARPTDSIDLRDLLDGEFSTQLDVGVNPDVGTLLEYLNFSVEGGSTVINISTQGNFAGDGSFEATQVDQRIVLDGVNLYADTGSASQTELLQKILVNGTLIVD